MRKSHDHEHSSGRHLRVGEAIRHALVEIFAAGHFREPELRDASITVTEARTTPDLRNVTVFVMPLGGRGRDEIVAALNREAHWLRGEVTRAVRLKFAPQLRFSADETFDAADRVTALLHDPRVARDLAPPPSDKPARRSRPPRRSRG
jgi:ribosome-binding factor A